MVFIDDVSAKVEFLDAEDRRKSSHALSQVVY